MNGMVCGAGSRQRSSNGSCLMIGIVRTTTMKGVGGESGTAVFRYFGSAGLSQRPLRKRTTERL